MTNSLTSLQKFKFPLAITLLHMTIKFAMASVFRLTYHLFTGRRRATLTCSNNLRRIALPGIAGSIDIGLSNWGLEFVTITLYTMTKSTCIIFILFFSLLFKLEKMRVSLVAVVTLITVGLLMFTYNLTAFSLFGFLLVFCASFSSGLRWTCTQLAMNKEELGLNNPLDMMYYIQPWMIMVLVPIALFIEGPSLVELLTTTSQSLEPSISVVQQNLSAVGSPHLWLALPDSTSSEYLPVMTTVILGSAVIAFFLEFSEFVLIYSTSCLTLSIASILKEVCTLTLASVINNETMSTTNMIGLMICLLGIAIHVILKAVTKDEEDTRHAHAKDYQKIQLIASDKQLIEADDHDEYDVYQR